ncbi:hypothetical protein N8Y11_19955 [Enterobacter mori]|nr:hypothetical protein [Enterobacter mori]
MARKTHRFLSALGTEGKGDDSGFKDEIDNQDWIIARAEHVIDDSGFTTRLELEAKIPDWIAETE